MKIPSLTDRTFIGFIWLLAGTGTQAILRIAGLIVLARLLSPSDYGLVGAAAVILGLSHIFSQLGVGPAIVQRAELGVSHIRVGFTLSLLLGCFVGIVVALAGQYIAIFFRMPELRPVIQALALIFPISGFSVVAEALLIREMQFKKLAFIGIINYILGYAAVGITLALLGWGVWALVFAQLGQAITNTTILMFVRRGSMGIALMGLELKQLLNFGAGFSLARIANYAATEADNLVVGRWLGAEALGIYGRAYQFLMMPAILFGTVVDRVLFPAMASVQNDKERLSRAYTRGVAVVAMTALPLSGTLIILAPEIVHVLLGQQWLSVALPFQVLASILVFRTSYKMSDSLARATGAVYRRAWRQWIYAVTVFVCAWVGHFWGLTGVAIGASAAIVINFFLMLHLSIKLTETSWLELGIIHGRHFTVSTIVTVCIWTFKEILGFYGMHPIFILLGGGVIFLMVLLFLWVVFPRIFGEEGVWIFSLIKHHVQSVSVRLCRG